MARHKVWLGESCICPWTECALCLWGTSFLSKLSRLLWLFRSFVSFLIVCLFVLSVTEKSIEISKYSFNLPVSPFKSANFNGRDFESLLVTNICDCVSPLWCYVPLCLVVFIVLKPTLILRWPFLVIMWLVLGWHTLSHDLHVTCLHVCI